MSLIDADMPPGWLRTRPRAPLLHPGPKHCPLRTVARKAYIPTCTWRLMVSNMSDKSDRDNHSNQGNPNNDAYWESRGFDERPDDWEDRSEGADVGEHKEDDE